MWSLPPFLLFDLDDTILNFDGVSLPCWQTLCQEFAPRLSRVSTQDLFSAIESARDWFWSDPERHRMGRLDLLTGRRMLVERAFRQLGQADLVLSRAMADAYTEQREELVYPFEGVVDRLRLFQTMGIRMGLITNGSAAGQRRKIERFELTGLFDVILIEGEYGIGKPDHRIFQEALRVLGADCQQAWMVGNDLEYDIRPALEMGLCGVWVDHSQAGLPANHAVIPTRIIHSLIEL